MESLLIQPTSQAQAIQRSGRGGRMKYGKCFRLYTEATFKTLQMTSTPEMQRSNLEWTVLQLKGMGIDDIIHFDFMSPPPVEAIIRALEVLYALGALDDECKLTPLVGQILCEFPLPPRLGGMLLASMDMGCTEDILTVTSMLSVNNPFIKLGNTKEAKENLETSFSELSHKDGDHVTLLNIYNNWVEEGGGKDTWCLGMYSYCVFVFLLRFFILLVILYYYFYCFFCILIVFLYSYFFCRKKSRFKSIKKGKGN